MDNKTCTTCCQIKSATLYHKDSRSKDGLRTQCKVCRNTVQAKYRLNNLAEVNATSLKTYYKNKEHYRSTQKDRYYKTPRWKYNAASAKHLHKKSTPAWSNLNTIKDIYKNCPEGMQVDHIIPMGSDLVSGLHVPANLQYLTPFANASKKNRFQP